MIEKISFTSITTEGITTSATSTRRVARITSIIVIISIIVLWTISTLVIIQVCSIWAYGTLVGIFTLFTSVLAWVTSSCHCVSIGSNFTIFNTFVIFKVVWRYTGITTSTFSARTSGTCVMTIITCVCFWFWPCSIWTDSYTFSSR